MTSNRRFDHDSRWTFVKKDSGHKDWFRCACGTEKLVNSYHVTHGMSASCGCLRKEEVSKRRLQHGMSESREYRIWSHMKDRCYNPNTLGFENWGGRGITICDRWRDSFDSFYEDMGPCPDGYHSINRIENDGNYEPGNCRWGDRIEQMNNCRSNIHMDLPEGRLTIAEAARAYGLKYATVWRRYVLAGDDALSAVRGVGQ